MNKPLVAHQPKFIRSSWGGVILYSNITEDEYKENISRNILPCPLKNKGGTLVVTKKEGKEHNIKLMMRRRFPLHKCYQQRLPAKVALLLQDMAHSSPNKAYEWGVRIVIKGKPEIKKFATTYNL